MPTEPRRPDPELLLRQVEAEEAREKRGSLKVFLGYASGVGKSFRMLDEARRRKERGEDLVVVGTQAERSTAVDGLLGGCEVIPLKYVNGFPVLDMERILPRKPGVAVDRWFGLRKNSPGPWPTKGCRWPRTLSKSYWEHGISVHHFPEYSVHRGSARSKSKRFRGKRASLSRYRRVFRRADELVVVDAPPEYLH